MCNRCCFLTVDRVDRRQLSRFVLLNRHRKRFLLQVRPLHTKLPFSLNGCKTLRSLTTPHRLSHLARLLDGYIATTWLAWHRRQSSLTLLDNFEETLLTDPKVTKRSRLHQNKENQIELTAISPLRLSTSNFFCMNSFLLPASSRLLRLVFSSSNF